MHSFFIQALLSFALIGLPAIAWFIWCLFRMRVLRWSGSSDERDGRRGWLTGDNFKAEVSWGWKRTRLYHIHLEFFPSHGDGEDLEFSMAFRSAGFWLKVGNVFSRETRVRFLKRWGNGYQSRKVGISYHDAAFWFSLWEPSHEHSSTDPRWWSFVVHMPWDRVWVFTEILDHDCKTVVWRDDRGITKARRRRKIPLPILRERDWIDRQASVEASVSRVYPYRYVRKNGQVQAVNASIHVDRMAWGFRWLPFPFYVKTYIDVRFSAEVGEGTGSWKGGVLGCSYEMKSGETPLDALRRMEADRKFMR